MPGQIKPHFLERTVTGSLQLDVLSMAWRTSHSPVARACLAQTAFHA
jgi:hypothetical protein